MSGDIIDEFRDSVAKFVNKQVSDISRSDIDGYLEHLRGQALRQRRQNMPPDLLGDFAQKTRAVYKGISDVRRREREKRIKVNLDGPSVS